MYKIKEENTSDISDDSTYLEDTKFLDSTKRHLISIIADEDTCVGYLMAGIGEVDKNECVNYAIVNEKARTEDIEMAFQNFIERDDIAIVLIAKDPADKIDYLIRQYSRTFPVVMIIPGKNGPYDISIDHIMRIANDHKKQEAEQQLKAKSSHIMDKNSITARSSLGSLKSLKSSKSFK